MAVGNMVWGMEIGQCALKAIKLRDAGDGKVEVLAFVEHEHKSLLSQPDADVDGLITSALQTFASEHPVARDKFVIGVPGHQTFARFTKLPPVEEKKIPDIVRFEAGQQIPFDMADVVWDYEVFRAPESPDIEVGIFAMRKDLVRRHIEYYNKVGITPAAIQTIPSALYNFWRFDGGGEAEEPGATVVVDVGAQHTDLIIVEAHSAWTRNIPLGGNNFTDALVKAFKLPFGKAEEIKRTGASSKHARQIFQAMRPVFADLVAEIQRSIGFYSSTHRDVELKRVLACGNAFRLPGLQKYLENNLTISGGVARLESFRRAVFAPEVNEAQFKEALASFGPVYGLALQGLGLSNIRATLLPSDLARVQMWNKKRPYFIATAACLGLAAALPWTRITLDRSALASNEEPVREARRLIDSAKKAQSEFSSVSKNTDEERGKINALLELQKDRAMVPRILTMVYEALPREELLASAQTPEERKKVFEANKGRLARQLRKEFYIDSIELEYNEAIDSYKPVDRGGSAPTGLTRDPFAQLGGGRLGELMAQQQQEEPEEDAGGEGAGGDGFYVRISGRTTYGKSRSETLDLIEKEFFQNLKKLGQRPGLGWFVPDEDSAHEDKKNFGNPPVVSQYFVGVREPTLPFAKPAPAAPGAAAAPSADEVPEPFRDPVTGEDVRNDWRFSFGFKIRRGDMPEKPAQAEGEQPAEEQP